MNTKQYYDVLVLAANGSENIELFAPCNIFERCGLTYIIVKVPESGEERDNKIRPGRGREFNADGIIDEINPENFKIVYIPGGGPGSKIIGSHKLTKSVIEHFKKNKKVIAAICAAPYNVLYKLGFLKDIKHFTGYPEESFKEKIDSLPTIIMDDNIITGTGMAQSFEMGFAIAGQLVEDKSILSKVRYGACFLH